MRFATLITVLLLGIFSAERTSAQQQYTYQASTSERQSSIVDIEGLSERATVLPVALGVTLHIRPVCFDPNDVLTPSLGPCFILIRIYSDAQAVEPRLIKFATENFEVKSLDRRTQEIDAEVVSIESPHWRLGIRSAANAVWIRLSYDRPPEQFILLTPPLLIGSDAYELPPITLSKRLIGLDSAQENQKFTLLQENLKFALLLFVAPAFLIIITFLHLKPRVPEAKRGLTTATYVVSLTLSASALPWSVCAVAVLVTAEGFAWTFENPLLDFESSAWPLFLLAALILKLGLLLAPAVILLSIIRQFWGLEKRLLVLLVSTVIYCFCDFELRYSVVSPIVNTLYLINVLALAVPHFRLAKKHKSYTQS